MRVTKGNLTPLIESCVKKLEEITPNVSISTQFSFLKMKKKEVVLHSYPFVWQYRKEIFDSFQSLLGMLSSPDEVWISVESYDQIIKLSKGEKVTNPSLLLIGG